MSKESGYNIFRLSNGLRCVFMHGERVGYCGVVVNAGSREDGLHPGIAHFVEHTLFKGTLRRTSSSISNLMESLGGELNAYTSKEETVVYTVFPAGYSAKAIDLLSDIVINSQFPEAELAKERSVILEEINSYLDSPSDAIFDDFEDLLYADTALGHNILGTAESLDEIRGEHCREFLDSYYTPDNMVVYCIDSCSASQAQRRLEKAFGKMHYASKVARKRVVEATPQFSVVKKIDSHQSHTLDGVRLPGRTSENRHAFFLLNNYLGGPSMNSCLNRELRDKRGYVYSVDSFVGMMSDVGQFAVYFACDSERIRACRRILRRELTRLAESPMKPVSFAKIKRQYLGQLKVSADRRDHQAVAMGKSLLYYGEVHDIDYASARIEEVTAEKMQQAAQYILNAGISGISMI